MVQLDNDVHIAAARLVSSSGELRSAADQIAAKARGLAASHNKTGNYASSFGVEPSGPGANGVTDYVVYNDDPAAKFIEFGHKNRDGGRTEGLHIMQRAVGG